MTKRRLFALAAPLPPLVPALLLAAVAALATAGCIGPVASISPADTPSQPFVVIQPEEARLTIAAHELKGRIGHEVNVDVDPAILKEHASNLQIELSDALETISRGLDQARAQRPDAVLRVTATLGTLRIQLDEKLREHWVELTDEGAMVLHVPTHATYFVSDASVTSAILGR